MKHTIVKVTPTQQKTSKKHIPLYSLNYIAGDARLVEGRVPFDLRMKNENFLHTAGLEPESYYVMGWMQSGTTITEGGNEYPSFRCTFDQISPIDVMVKAKLLQENYPGEGEKEAAWYAEYRKMKDAANKPASDEYSFQADTESVDDLPF